MKLSFPHMGPVTVYKKLLEAFDHEVVMPDKPSQLTFDLGTKYSPEFLCFPFKCLMGTYIEAAGRGAEGIVTTGGDDACRAGFYAEVHKRILKSMGYNLQFFVFDSLYKHPREFLGNIAALKGEYTWSYVLKTIYFCYSLIAAMDRLEARIRIMRAHEKVKGSFSKAWDDIQVLFEGCRTTGDISAVEQEGVRIINGVPIKSSTNDTVRVGIVGEIYVAMEGHANMELEQALANMGVEVVNSQYVSHWLQHNISLPWRKPYLATLLEKATPYLKIPLGGHDKENIAHIIEFSKQGIDGIVHLMPFACLPELVTQSILPKLSQDLRLPILSLALDEQRGTANNQTRLEAFIDLVKNNKLRSHGGSGAKRTTLVAY